MGFCVTDQADMDCTLTVTDWTVEIQVFTSEEAVASVSDRALHLACLIADL